MAEGNTTVLDRDQVAHREGHPTTTREKEAAVLKEMEGRLGEMDGLRNQLAHLSRERGKAIKNGDKNRYDELEKQYKLLSSARTTEEVLNMHIKEDMEERAKKAEAEGRTDPGGELLNLFFKAFKDGEGKEIGGVFQIDRKWEKIGWNNENLERVRSNMITMLSQFKHSPQFNPPFEFDFSVEKQKALLELLVGSGFTASEILAKLDQEQLIARIAAKSNTNRTKWGGMEYGFADYFHSLGIREDYVKRYIFPELFQNQEEDMDYLQDPDSVEKLAWQMGARGENQALWGIHGKFPLLEMRIITEEDKGTGQEKVNADKSQYHLNKGNFRRWIRERMSNLYDLSPDSAPNYFEAVVFNKGPFYRIPLQDFFYRKNEFLASENDWIDYVDVMERDMQLDPWMMLYARQAWVTMNKDQGSDKVGEILKGLHNMNDATKKVYGGNMMRFLTTIPLNDSNARDDGGFIKRDSTIGAAWTEMLLIFEHMSDFDKLEEILGKDSRLFTKEYFDKAMKDFAGKIARNTNKRDAYAFLGKEYADNFQKAFDEQGFVTSQANKDNFIAILNIFSAHAEDANKAKFVREHLLPDIMAEKFNFQTEKGVDDPYSKWMAWLLAYSWTNWTGVASMNDTTAQAFNTITKWVRPAQYRLKMADNRAGGIGNPRTIFQYKQLYVPFLWAVKTTARTDVRDRNGEITGVRDKSMIEVLHELQELRTKQLNYLNYLEHVTKVSPEDLAEERRKMDVAYQTKAGELEFRDNAQRVHQVDHVERVVKIWDRILNAKEIDFHKFTHYDPYSPGMPQFDREAFQKEIQDTFLKDLRYAFEVYGDINFNMIVRAPKLVPDKSKKGYFKFKTAWETMPLGQAMFGHELLDREEFWVRGKNGIPLRDRDNHRIIDYNKVQANKTLIWKQWAIMKFAADVQQHRMKYSMDRKFPPSYYEHVFEALESIPGAVWGDEYRMSKTIVPENFFNHHDMAILKRKALAGPWLGVLSSLPVIGDITEKLARTRFYLQWLWRDLRAKEDEEGMGIGILVGNLFGQVFKEK